MRLDFKKEMKNAFLQAKIADLWKTCFHRADKNTRHNQTAGWMFFLSRPAIELLRKMSPGTEGLTNFLRDEVSSFLSHKGEAKNWLNTSLENPAPSMVMAPPPVPISVGDTFDTIGLDIPSPTILNPEHLTSNI